MGRRMERKYHSHLSVVTLEARDVRPGPERAGVASSPAHASRGSAETQRGVACGSRRVGGAAPQPRQGLQAITWWVGAGPRPRISWVATTAAQKPGARVSPSFLISPELGWAGPGHSRASVSTPGTASAILRLTLESQSLLPSLLRFVRSGSKCWVRPPARPVYGLPGTRLSAVPWRAPSRRSWERAPAFGEPALSTVQAGPRCACVTTVIAARARWGSGSPRGPFVTLAGLCVLIVPSKRVWMQCAPQAQLLRI